MYSYYADSTNLDDISVCGVPFKVKHNDKGVAEKLNSYDIEFRGNFDTLYFLGMSTDSDYCSEWWAQNEVMYDYSYRLFIGDRIARIRVIFDDLTEDLISVIFGVNCFNYNLFYRPKDSEGLMAFSSPYQEPFIHDKAAAKLLDDALMLTENTADDATKNTKWIFTYRLRPEKRVSKIIVVKEDSKRSGIAVSAVTGSLDEPLSEPISVRAADQSFFLSKKYFAPTYRLSRRLYQYADDIPEHVDKLDIDNFDGPDVSFVGSKEACILTNIYKVNIFDMAYNKVSDDGMPHTSSPGSSDYGCYLGMGTYKDNGGGYASHVWTRDTGRMLTELINFGYRDRALLCAEKLLSMLYYKSKRFNIPHWKRVANLTDSDFNEGKENDGHASIMMYIYTMYKKGVVDKTWIDEHKQALTDAANFYVWQSEHPAESNFCGMLFSESETSTQTNGGYDLYANIISAMALSGFAEMLNDSKFRALADSIYMYARKSFTMLHPKYGEVFTDTTDDCWTYEYKRFGELMLQADFASYDVYLNAPVLYEQMSRTYEAQKELFYSPYSGRQMGYGQSYITQSAILLDRYKDFTDCIEVAADYCYHHSDNCYVVPEGVICSGDKSFWFRNSDLGNSVQQAEILKCIRLLIGIDNTDTDNDVCLIPRLPDGWKDIKVSAYPVVTKEGNVIYTSLDYTRGSVSSSRYITASDGHDTYTLSISDNMPIRYMRIGPFTNNAIDIIASSNICYGRSEIKKIYDRYFIYLY